MNSRKLVKPILSVGLIFFFLVGCGMPSTPMSIPPKAVPTSDIPLFYAASLGLPLGILAAKYEPGLPEGQGDAQRRELYTSLLQSSADGLNIVLSPSPASLLSAGRGQQQYDVIKSYFEQIGKNTKDRSRCIRYTTSLSLNSAWLVLGAHEARYVIDIQAFKQKFLWRQDQFSALAIAASMACEEEGFAEYSKNLKTISEESLTWQTRILSSNDNELVATVESFGQSLADWLVSLSAAAGGLPTPAP